MRYLTYIIAAITLFSCVCGNTDAALSEMSGYFQNTVLAGFYPDLAMKWVRDDYYLVHSSIAFFPADR